MTTNTPERSHYKIEDSHRNQAYVGLLRRDPDTHSWSWKGHIDFSDGDNFEFASQRTFTTRTEAEDYMRRFARDRIDNRLALIQSDRF